MIRNNDASKLVSPGPTRVLRPALPKRSAAGRANSEVSNHFVPGPTPPRYAMGPAMSGRFAAPDAFKAAASADALNTFPDFATKIPFNDQLPITCDHKPCRR